LMLLGKTGKSAFGKNLFFCFFICSSYHIFGIGVICALRGVARIFGEDKMQATHRWGMVCSQLRVLHHCFCCFRYCWPDFKKHHHEYLKPSSSTVGYFS
jgi:hypothetical protein